MQEWIRRGSNSQEAGRVMEAKCFRKLQCDMVNAITEGLQCKKIKMQHDSAIIACIERREERCLKAFEMLVSWSMIYNFKKNVMHMNDTGGKASLEGIANKRQRSVRAGYGWMVYICLEI